MAKDTPVTGNEPTRRVYRSLAQTLSVFEGMQLELWREQRLTMTQVRVLFRLHRLGHATVGQIADALRITPSTATGLVERLVQHGVVRRQGREGDRRVVEVGLTESGERAVAQLSRIEGGAIRQALAELPAADVDELGRLLERLVVGLQRAASPGAETEPAPPHRRPLAAARAGAARRRSPSAPHPAAGRGLDRGAG
ncbi:MAG TPA: MarR family transcriptional regulator [Candidatus Micrarchaeia archaeon]|nr:MarR family transcriptional regulator [Candidatus Micrarchaeia archaeon]